MTFNSLNFEDKRTRWANTFDIYVIRAVVLALTIAVLGALDSGEIEDLKIKYFGEP